MKQQKLGVGPCPTQPLGQGLVPCCARPALQGLPALPYAGSQSRQVGPDVALILLVALYCIGGLTVAVHTHVRRPVRC